MDSSGGTTFFGQKFDVPWSEGSRLQRGSAGLLEGLRQLQDAAFPERRTENLQADWELPADFAAWYGNPGYPG
jgi:hypothetical protein